MDIEKLAYLAVNSCQAHVNIALSGLILVSNTTNQRGQYLR